MKEFKYRSAKVKLTGSASSMEIMFSFSSEALAAHDVRITDVTRGGKLGRPLVTLMDTAVPMVAKSLQMRWNSTDGILMVTAYSVSGIPKCSLSMSMSFNSEVEIFLGSSFRLRQSLTRPASSPLAAVTIAPIASRTRRLKHKRHDITGIVRFHGDRVVVTGALQRF